jgi:hypothetical protein
MKNLRTAGVLVAVSILLWSPSSLAQFDAYLNTPTSQDNGQFNTWSGMDNNVSNNIGQFDAANQQGFQGQTTGSRTPDEYRATLQDGGGDGGEGSVYGSAAQGDKGHTTEKTLIHDDSQYHHDPAPDQMVISPRNRSSLSKQAMNQQWLYQDASTELIAPQSINTGSYPSGKFKLGFRSGSFTGPVAPWKGSAPPPTATSSCDFNIVDR